MKTIGCFHAHYSNIEHIERALAPHGFELAHFVDPGLDRIKHDADFSDEVVRNKIQSTLDWIARCHVDAILITCAFFTANVGDTARFPIPIFRIDDPLFALVCRSEGPVAMAFTNPGTVDGTMERLAEYARSMGVALQAEPVLIENTFELIMQGKQREYVEAVELGLRQLIERRPDLRVFAAQLSMVPAAQAASAATGRAVGNHLDSLADYMKRWTNAD